jgi:hypothetical protein
VVSNQRFNGHGPRLLLGLIPAAALSCACFLGAAGASAAVRFAAPGGNQVAGSECLQSNPCSLFNAASRFAPASKLDEGDDVLLEPGTYSGAAGELGPEASIATLAHVSIHGIASQPRPVISVQGGNGGVAFSLDQPGETLSGLEILGRDSSGPWELSAPSSVIDGVIAVSSGERECFARQGLVRNSVCLSTGKSTPGLEVLPAFGAPGMVELRNVTAVATGADAPGLAVVAFGGQQSHVHGIGVLARGKAEDVNAGAFSNPPHTPGTGGAATVDLDHSDFATVKTENDAGGGSATLTAPGTGTNVTAAPLLAVDGYHELAGSPTIDAGALDASSGGIDIDGGPRLSGGAADIGADEFPAPTPNGAGPPPGPVPRPPDTRMGKKPARRTATRRARFTFAADQPGSRFECKLDKGRFKPCHSPFTHRVEPGRHRFSVRAVNRAGEADRSPASFRWTVLPTGRA